MTGLVSIGDQLRIVDPASGDNGVVGVVDRVELTGVRLVLPGGRKVRRSWGVERLSGWRPIEEAPVGETLIGWRSPSAAGQYGLFRVHTRRFGYLDIAPDGDFWPQYPPTHWMRLPSPPPPAELSC